MSLLSLQTVTKIFGGLTAVNEVSFDVEQGSIVGLIGPNGAVYFFIQVCAFRNFVVLQLRILI